MPLDKYLQEEKNKKSSTTQKIFLVIIAIFISLTFLELISGVLMLKPNGHLVGDTDEFIDRKYQKNLNITIEAEDSKDEKIQFVTNNYGFVGENWTLEKKQGITRLANLGDSFTAGASVYYTKNYSTLVGSILSDYFGTKIESLNFGVSEQDTLDQLNTYVYKARQFDPDIVILYMYPANDLLGNLNNVISTNKTPQTENDKKKNLDLLGALISKSKLIRLLKLSAMKSQLMPSVFNFLKKSPLVEKAILKIFMSYGQPSPELRLVFTNENVEQNKLVLDKTKQYLESINNKIIEDGKKLFVVIIPNEFQVNKHAEERLLKQYPSLAELAFDPLKPNTELKKIMDELAIEYIDLENTFKNYCKNQDKCQLYMCSYCHFSEKGHKLTAETVADALIENNLIEVIN